MCDEKFEQALDRYDGMTTLTALFGALIILADYFVLRIKLPLQIIFSVFTVCLLLCCFRMYDGIRRSTPPVKQSRPKTTGRCLLAALVGITIVFTNVNPIIDPWVKAVVFIVGMIFVLRMPTRKYRKSTNREEHV